MADPKPRQSIPSTTRVYAYTIVALVALVCFTIAGIFVPSERWEKLGHFLTDPATAVAFSSLVAVVGAMIARARHQAPPLGLVLAVALGTTVLAAGCGSAVTTTAHGVDVAAQLLAPTMAWTDDTRAAELDACTDEPCLDAGEARWAGAVDALNAARDSLVAVLDALDLVHAHATDAPTMAQIVGLARAAVDAWAAAASIAHALGRELPDLPEEVRSLVGGAS